MDAAQEPTRAQPVVREGYAKKRNGRMQQWTHRYFVLTTSMLSYKIKQEAAQYRYTYDLSPGCLVTEIASEPRVAGKKLYSFWVVWPHEKKGEKEKDKKDDKANESDDDNVKSDDEKGPQQPPAAGQQAKVKDLKQIVEQEAMVHRRQKNLVNEQLELHHAHDHNVSIGAKVAAVAVGGVVVGALTAGIGLIPYLTVVGITAAASGGAVAFTFRRPMDSRLIMACETMAEAMEWKTAIERQIATLGDAQRPALPASVDRSTIYTILDRAMGAGMWKTVRVCDRVFIQEYSSNTLPRCSEMMCTDELNVFKRLVVCPSLYREHIYAFGATDDQASRCRRGHIVVQASPTDVFLAMMNVHPWPRQGEFKVVKQIDDHADYVGIEAAFPSKTQRRLCFSRFWQMDDDGVYLITYNSAVCVEFPHAVKTKKMKDFELTSAEAITIHAVLTITPRQDIDNFEFDVPEALITCSCQINNAKGTWKDADVTAFMDEFLQDHLTEICFALQADKYDLQYRQQVLTGPAPSMVASVAPVSVKDPLGASPNERPVLSRTRSPTADTMVPLRDQSSPAPRSLTRRGVTTVQPGMEEEDGGAHEKRPNRLMRMFTSRKKHGEVSEAEPMPVQSAPPIVRHQGHPVNSAEGVKLRREIAAAEYELQRLAKALKKKTLDAGVLPPPPPDSPAQTRKSEFKELNERIFQLQSKVHAFKQSYLAAMGETYERAVQSRSALGRLRSLGKKRSTAGSLALDENDDFIDGSASRSHHSIDRVSSAAAALPRPRHWLPADYDLPVMEKKANRPTLLGEALSLLRTNTFYAHTHGLLLHRKFLPDLLSASTRHNSLFPSANLVVVFVVLLLSAAMFLLNHGVVMALEVAGLV